MSESDEPSSSEEGGTGIRELDKFTEAGELFLRALMKTRAGAAERFMERTEETFDKIRKEFKIRKANGASVEPSPPDKETPERTREKIAAGKPSPNEPSKARRSAMIELVVLDAAATATCDVTIDFLLAKLSKTRLSPESSRGSFVTRLNRMKEKELLNWSDVENILVTKSGREHMDLIRTKKLSEDEKQYLRVRAPWLFRDET